jgi:hypothetical protein
MSTKFISIEDLFDMSEQELKEILINWTKHPTKRLLLTYGLLKERGAKFDDISVAYAEIDRNFAEGLEGSLTQYLKDVEVFSIIEIKEKVENGKLNRFGAKIEPIKPTKPEESLNVILRLSWVLWTFLLFVFIGTLFGDNDSNITLNLLAIVIFWLLFNILFSYLEIIIKNQERLLEKLGANSKE